MRSSKELFQASPEFKNYQTMISSSAFEPACNAALLVLIEELPSGAADPSKAWDCYLQIVGARKLIEKLSELHIEDSKQKLVKPDELKYQVAREPYRP